MQLTIDCRYHHPFKDQLEDVAEGLDLWDVGFSEFPRLSPVRLQKLQFSP